MALAEMHVNEAVPILIDMINDNKNVGNRGTMLYALEKLDCREYLPLFVEIMCTGGGGEVSWMSYLLIEKYLDDLSDSEMNNIKNALYKYRSILSEKYSAEYNEHPFGERQFLNRTLEQIEE